MENQPDKTRSFSYIVIFSAVLWGIFAAANSFVGATEMYHYLTPIFIATVALILIVYGRGLPEIWRKRKEGIDSSGLLILGLMVAGSGLIIRLFRWYLVSNHSHPADESEFWFFNIGMAFGIWGALFLLGAARVAVKTFNPGTLVTIFLLIFSVLLYIDLANIDVIQFKDIPQSP